MTGATVLREGLSLRDYQRESLDRIAAAEARGVRRQLLVAATGLGKTVIFASLIEARPGRAVVLAHRDELIAQAAAKMLEIDPALTPTPAVREALVGLGRLDLLDRHATDNRRILGIVKAGADNVNADVVVASVQTLSRQARLDRLVASQGAMGPIGLVVVDEAHHVRAASYGRILNGLGAGAPDGPLLLGVTATPDRGDGLGLDEWFDEVVAAYDILWGIGAGYLCDLRGLTVRLAGFDESALKVRGGDYVVGQAGQALQDANAPIEVVRAWQAHAAGRKTLVFTPTVALAQAMADEFQRAGIASGMVSGETPFDERKALLAQFRSGEVQVLANCAVLTEGYDEPSVDCIVIARPTKSRGLYVQMVGRGTRRHPTKDDCLVLDVVGAAAQHSLVTIPSLFGIEQAAHMRDGTGVLTEAIAEVERELVARGLLAAADAELFKKVRGAAIAWVPVPSRTPGLLQYQRSLGAKRRRSPDTGELETVRLPSVVLVQREGDDEWGAGLVWEPDQPGHLARTRMLIDRVPMEMAQGVAEDYVRKHATNLAIVSKDAPWRAKPPSERQLAAAKKWRLAIDSTWTAGELSDALDAHIARRKGLR